MDDAFDRLRIKFNNLLIRLFLMSLLFLFPICYIVITKLFLSLFCYNYFHILLNYYYYYSYSKRRSFGSMFNSSLCFNILSYYFLFTLLIFLIFSNYLYSSFSDLKSSSFVYISKSSIFFFIYPNYIFKNFPSFTNLLKFYFYSNYLESLK